MGERLFDELARSLVQPMPRRRVLRLAGAALIAGAVPTGLLPGRGSARAWPNCAAKPDLPYTCKCPNGDTGLNFELCCWTQAACHCEPRAALCCIEPAVWENGKCTIPCPPERSGCGVCCASDQVCNKRLKTCCPRDPDYPCVGPDPACKKKADDEVEDYQRSTCRKGTSAAKGSISTLHEGTSIDSMKEGAYFSLGCFAFSETVLRPSRYSRCKRVADASLCPAGSTCDAKSGLCSVPDCGGRSSSSTHQQAAQAPALDARSRVSDKLPGADAVLREYRRYGPRFRKDAVRLGRALDRPVNRSRTKSLAAALHAYHSDVTALEASLRRLLAGNPASTGAAVPLLQLLEHTASGLDSFESGVTATRLADAGRHGRAARRSFAAAERLAPKVRTGLGCDTAC